MINPNFLTLAEIVEIHNDQINLYGGEREIRDIALLESAISQPEATFQDKWLHENFFLMASAYAYHICKNHPFIDGNKRAALASALVFLELNGISVLDPEKKLFNGIMDIISNKIDKQGFSNILRACKEITSLSSFKFMPDLFKKS